MIEMNARVLAPGKDIALPVRYLHVQGTTNTPELREKICYRLRREHNLIAVPSQGRRGHLLVAANQAFPARKMTVDEWEVTILDVEECVLLTLDTAEGWQLLPEFAERTIINAIERRGDWWSFGSLRHWYEKTPFDAQEGIDALRRYVVSAIAIEGVGVAVSVDVETAFFTQDTVADFFDASRSADERRRRLARFNRLTQRQSGQHGTLLYNNGEATLKCYFEGFPPGRVCGNTAPRRVRGKTYDSLADYYRKVSPRLGIRGDDMAALVSFPGLDHPQPVAACCLKVRVMNDMLPASLLNVDKISPQERREMLISFWDRLGKVCLPFVTPVSSLSAKGPSSAMPTTDRVNTEKDASKASFLPGFWQPDHTRVRTINFPALHFGNGATLDPPFQMTAAAYKRHFKTRAEMLDTGKCYHFPPLIGRTLMCAYPEDRGICEAAEELAEGVCRRMQQMTGKPFEVHMVPYDSIEGAIAQLRREGSAQVVLFVLNDEAAAYTEAALGLPDWKIKRVTENTLRQQYSRLTKGSSAFQGARNTGREQRHWDAFLKMTSLDLFQEMDGVPFRLAQTGAFEAQLVIDVSYDRRYYALSLLIARDCQKQPSFGLIFDSWQKIDTKHEAINGRILGDSVVEFACAHFAAGKDVPFASLLVARDGKMVGDEQEFLEKAIGDLKRRGILTPDARVEFVEVHKNTEMHLRVWEIETDGAASNVLEATAVRLSASTEILITTGAGTLTQGTAEPLLVMAVNEETPVEDATAALAASAQLNWSSPGRAQRLPLPFKRTDEILKRRSEQEIRRIH